MDGRRPPNVRTMLMSDLLLVIFTAAAATLPGEREVWTARMMFPGGLTRTLSTTS